MNIFLIGILFVTVCTFTATQSVIHSEKAYLLCYEVLCSSEQSESWFKTVLMLHETLFQFDITSWLNNLQFDNVVCNRYFT